jgi:hypothetical protein
MPETAPVESPIPVHAGLGLAALVLGGVSIPVAAFLGVHCLVVSLPVFGLWFFLPVIVMAIALGMLAARSAQGVAGATLGVAALVLCVSFVLIDRSYGADIRAQLRPASAPSPSIMKLDQLMKMTGLPKVNVLPATQP